MSRKRDKPYFSCNAPISKRRRPLPPHPPPLSSSSAHGDDINDCNNNQPVAAAKPTPPPAVVVMGLSPNCSVLDLKSRFEIYGPISRIRIDRHGVGSITFRSKDSGEAAIAAALDPSFGITIDSKKVQVLWSTDPLAQWREGVGVGVNKDNGNAAASKLVRAEVPLSRHGRGRGRGGVNNKLASAIAINPNRSSSSSGGSEGETVLDVPFKGREIVAYDDIV